MGEVQYPHVFNEYIDKKHQEYLFTLYWSKNNTQVYDYIGYTGNSNPGR